MTDVRTAFPTSMANPRPPLAADFVAARAISVPAFETTLLQIELRKEELGTLVVDVIPLEAVVFVDGVLDGYDTASRDVTVEANQIARANLSLERTVARPVKPPRAPRPPRGDGPSAGRVALNTGVSLAAIGAGYMAFKSYAGATAAYDIYLADEDLLLAPRKAWVCRAHRRPETQQGYDGCHRSQTTKTRIEDDFTRVESVEAMHRFKPRPMPAEVARRVPAPHGQVTPLDEARCELVTGGDDLGWLAACLGLLGYGLIVHEPPELVAHLRELSGRLGRAAG